MMSKNFLFNIVLYVLVIAFTCIGAGYFVSESNSLSIVQLAIPLLVLEIYLLIRYLNKTNRRMAYFIDSIRNDDTSIQLPKDIRSKTLDELYNSLSFLNEKLKATKIEIGYNEQLLKTLIENTAGGFITIDESGSFEVLNRNARRYLDIEHTSNLNRLQEKDPQLYQTIKSIKPGEKRIHRIQRNDQLFVLSVSLAEIKYREELFKVVSLQDISRELDEQELESWHKLFRVITHEIMNSIAPITSLAQKLTSYFSSGDNIKQPAELDERTLNNTVQGLNVIDDMSKGLMSFVENFRQLNKVPEPKVEKIVLHDWLSELKILLVEILKNKEIDLNITLAANCNSIAADKKLLNQVLVNLVKNSYNAISAKGFINISVTLSDDGKTLFNISDNGKGILPEDMDKVFVPFFTTNEDGNGIGLSLSKQIMKLHGGQINLRSEVGKGTVVTLTI